MPNGSGLEFESKRIRGEVAVLDLKGRITAGRASARLAEEVDELIERGVVTVVLNLRNVHLVDCAGIGELLGCRSRACERGGGMKLVQVQPRLRQLLELFRLDPILESFASEHAAIASLGGRKESVPHQSAAGYTSAGPRPVLAGIPMSGA